MVDRYWFAVSTNRIPLFTTVPISIRNPIRDTILILQFVRNSSPKAPIRLNGMVVMTMKEYLGDSNWAAMTTNIRNTAVPIAPYRAENSSFMELSMEFSPMLTEEVRFGVTTSLLICILVSFVASSV